MELRPEEQWAQQMVAAALGVEVVQVDDGSADGMHDLGFITGDGRSAAVEVVAAADSDSIELWKLVNPPDQRWQVPDLRGGWAVSLLPSARAKTVKVLLPRFLRDLERAGLRSFGLRRGTTSGLAADAFRAGISSGFQTGTDFPGSIYPTIELPRERQGGWVDDHSSTLAAWIAEFLSAPPQADVLGKLDRSGCDERHAFVVVPGFSSAPFGVVDLLLVPGRPLPDRDPELPSPVTHVWLASTWTTGDGMRWDPSTGWNHFDKLTETAA